MSLVPEEHAALARLVAHQIEVFPEHAGYLQRRFAGESPAALAFSDELAVLVERICDNNLHRVLEDYRWLSGEILDEELFFRRNGRYRLTTFAEALEQVYGNRAYMTKYVNGILASQLWWHNHTEVMRYFRDAFIGTAPSYFSHLEVGPGHGLFLAMAAGSPGCRHAEGWDVSDASLAGTRDTLARMGIAEERILLRKIDIQDGPAGAFDSITFSEVLEHLEEPLAALRVLFRLLKPGGRIFINAPVNSPAPDHIHLFRTPEEVVDMISAAGFTIEASLFAPCTGASIERARRLKLSISTAVIASR